MEASKASAQSKPASPLEPYLIPSVPKSMYYIHDFLSKEECDALIAKIPANRWTSLSKRRLQAHPSQLTKNQTLLPGPLPTWLSDAPAPILKRFKSLEVFAGCSSSTSTHDASSRITSSSSSPSPNHVLVNEYLPGQGIMPHEDGGAYWPVVATVSLGASLVLDLYDKKQHDASDKDVCTTAVGRAPKYRILQEPGSLLVTTDEAYDCMLHGISEVSIDEDLSAVTVANWDLLGDRDSLVGGRSERGTRVSLTYRIVRKVSKINMAMLGIGGRRV